MSKKQCVQCKKVKSHTSFPAKEQTPDLDKPVCSLCVKNNKPDTLNAVWLSKSILYKSTGCTSARSCI